MENDELFTKIENCRKNLLRAREFVDNGKIKNASSSLREAAKIAEKINAKLETDIDKSPVIKDAASAAKNLIWSVGRFFSMPEKAARIFECEIFESFLRMEKVANFAYKMVLEPGALEKEYKRRAHLCRDLYLKRDEKKEYKYRATILLIGYNKLEYTKLAAESVLKTVDFSKGDVELITINNGSSDGTEEYFESLPNKKKLNFKHNIATVGELLNTRLVEGEYVVAVPNDAVATEGWLNGLLACISSDSAIGIAVPTCNHDAISCKQGVVVDYPNNPGSLEAIEDFGKKYNKTNPALWEDRTLLMPFTSIMRADLFHIHVGGIEYTKLVFIDDDFFTLLRRSGWRLVLAKDTYLQHFGSITLGDQKNKSNENAYPEMRKIYMDKWGVEPWESRGTLGIETVLPQITPQNNAHILWIDPKFGSDMLIVKNLYRKKIGKDPVIDTIITDERYFPDARYMTNSATVTYDIIKTLESYSYGYHLIAASSYLHEFLRGDAIKLILKLYELLVPGGKLFVPVKNFGSASEIASAIIHGGSISNEGAVRTTGNLPLWALMNELNNVKELENFTRAAVPDSNAQLVSILEQRLAGMYSNFSQEELAIMLKISGVWLGFTKQ